MILQRKEVSASVFESIQPDPSGFTNSNLRAEIIEDTIGT
jgi:hypothetical protein